MGRRFHEWVPRTHTSPQSWGQFKSLILENRRFEPADDLQYGDHGLLASFELVKKSIEEHKRIALYADYDVDGTMSCVSWIWFFEAIGYKNYMFYIPDRFKEGYGLNLTAIQYLVNEEKAQTIITMDTGITANEEAKWCKEQGVNFLCTDHHKIQPEKMPDCVILNPKLHPDPSYQELCGCGVTFVLLRKLGQVFSIPQEVWVDILALVGMATICDVVPLNGVNHRLAKHGVGALLRSKRPVFSELLKTSQTEEKNLDEQDIGFRLGPRINAVGRLYHGKKVIEAFIHNNPGPLAVEMSQCNEERKVIQEEIVKEAREKALLYPDSPILFLGGSWHEGVVGIAASKIAEEFWKPTWLFCYRADGTCKGSARSIPKFDVTQGMIEIPQGLFTKFGGHGAAGGFAFTAANEESIRKALTQWAEAKRQTDPKVWVSQKTYDFVLPQDFMTTALADSIKSLRPFGQGFEEPLFCLEAKIEEVQFLKDRQTQKPKHTTVLISKPKGGLQKIMFFHQVYTELTKGALVRFLVSAQVNFWQGQKSLSLYGQDFEVL